MSRKNKITYCLLFVSFLLLWSCKTGKALLDDKTHDKTLGNVSALVDTLFLRKNNADYVSYKMKLTIQAKGKRISANSTLKVQNNRFIVLSVSMPLLGIELGRIEIDSDNVFLIDKLHKIYVDMSFSEISEMVGADITLSTVQSLFLNDIFVLDSDNHISLNRLFEETRLDNGNILLSQKKNDTKLEFEVNPVNKILLRTLMENTGKGVTEWVYSDFSDVDGIVYPSYIKAGIGKTSPSIFMDFEISKVGNEKTSVTKIDLSKYRKVNLNECLKMLEQL